MATKLDDALVTDALAGLGGWSGDAARITRTVQIDGPAADGVLAQIATAADTMDHHPEISRDGDSVTFTLWTHSLDGVTELDIALASRIDDLLAQAGVPGEREYHRQPEVVTEAADEAGGQPWQSDHDQAEPFAGVPSSREGVQVRGVVLPDTAPGSPQPGIATDEGQGSPPAGQEPEPGAG